MAETDPAPASQPCWKERLIAAVERAVCNPHRQTIIVLIYERGCWRVIPAPQPVARIAVTDT